MRSFILILSFMVFFTTILYVFKIRDLEILVLELYKNDFKEYIVFDEDQTIAFDLEKLTEYFNDKGYCVEFDEESLRFIVSFQKVFYFEKEYYFYLQKNNEIK